MKPSALLPLLATAAAAAATDTFFVGSYGGSVDTLAFDIDAVSIKSLSSASNSPQASWQELSADKKFLYSVEETAEDDGSGVQKGAVTSYAVADDGSLTKVDSALGPWAPVSIGISPDGKLLFTANYGSASCSAFSTDAAGSLSHIHDFNFTSDPGPRPGQEESHPHQVLFDPSGKYFLVPDLGADLIRIFAMTPNADTPAKEISTIKTEPGTGPRHGTFYPPNCAAKFYYVVGEKSNTVIAYSVLYTDDGLELSELQTLSTLPDDYKDKLAPAAGEIQVSPHAHGNGQHTLYVSNRLDFVYEPGTGNSMAAYTVDKCSGKLELLEIFNAQVNNTRHFTVHPSGKWMVTEGMESGDLAVLEVGKEDGKVGKEAVARFEIDQPACLTWL